MHLRGHCDQLPRFPPFVEMSLLFSSVCVKIWISEHGAILKEGPLRHALLFNRTRDASSFRMFLVFASLG